MPLLFTSLSLSQYSLEPKPEIGGHRNGGSGGPTFCNLSPTDMPTGQRNLDNLEVLFLGESTLCQVVIEHYQNTKDMNSVYKIKQLHFPCIVVPHTVVDTKR